MFRNCLCLLSLSLQLASWHGVINSSVKTIVEEDLMSEDMINELKLFSLADYDNCCCIQDFSESFKHVDELEKFFSHLLSCCI